MVYVITITTFTSNDFSNLQQKIWSMCYLSTGGLLVYGGISIYNNNNRFYDNILMPISRYLSAETSHSLALTLAKYKIFPKSKFVDPPILVSVNFFDKSSIWLKYVTHKKNPL